MPASDAISALTQHGKGLETRKVARYLGETSNFELIRGASNEN